MTLWTGEIIHHKGAKATMLDRILSRVCEEYEVSPDEVMGKRRTARISWPRQMAMTLTRRLTTMSLAEVASHFGKRDHGTVIHAVKVVNYRCGKGRDHAFELDEIEIKLRGEEKR